MNKKIEEWLLEFGEIIELQHCLHDVLENCMYTEEKPFYVITLINYIKEKSSILYEELDNFCIESQNND